MSENTIKYHRPEKLSLEGLPLDYNAFGEEMAQAIYALGEVQGSQRELQNSSLLISPLSAKEATVSSSIEGTQSTVSDVFLYEATGKSKHSDTPFVVNYRVAIYQAISELGKGRKISPHLLESLHATLLKGVRHKGTLGKFRGDRVWIAEKEGDPIEKAIYIPPQHILVREYMENLFDYIESGKENILIKTGIAHYQFEAVHPFEDGNGRIGRLLIPLLLYDKSHLSQPILYISGYFDDHKGEYIDALHEVDKTGKYEKWLSFYFRSICAQLKDTQNLINKIYKLHKETKARFEGIKSPYLLQFIDMLFEAPFFTVPQAKKSIKASSRGTVLNLIEIFADKGLVVDTRKKDGSAKIYAFPALLELLK